MSDDGRGDAAITQGARVSPVLDLRLYGPGRPMPEVVFDFIEGRVYFREGREDELNDRSGRVGHDLPEDAPE